MIVERMAAKACFLIAGMDVDDHGPKLTEAHDLFVATQAVQREGNATRGLAPEENERIIVLDRLAAGEALWLEMAAPIAAALSAGEMTSEQLREVVRVSTPLMTAANEAVFVIEGLD